MASNPDLQESDASSKSSVKSGPWENPRLSTDVLPESYKLLIHPNIETGTLEGQVLIKVKVIKPTLVILLHSTDLTINNTTITSKNDDTTSEILIEKTWSYPPNHYWVIELKEELQEGNYEIFMSYKGRLSSSTLGLYKSSYKNSNNEECSCILSYFEATYARCAFPCFDEPSFRAVFKIRIAHDANSKIVALSNMCREKETLDYPEPNVKTVYYKPTPPMPPYLTAFMLGDFAYTEPVSSRNNVSIAIYSRPEIVQFMKKSLAFAVSVLDFFENYFDVPFNLGKLDLIALPDSNIGGMENWGLITFREDRLILNDDSTCDDLKFVSSIIAHEISHMWFGDLVTIAWWDNLWLKEGFASYMETVVGAHFFPEWFNDWVAMEKSNRAMTMDAPLDSHPLIVTVNSTAEIREAFDDISYSKGSVLIRMLADLNPDGFQAGISSYLKRYQFQSTVTQNLWDELQEKMKLDVASFMDTWTQQMGFPVLQVNCVVGSRVSISQSRFLMDKNSSYDPQTSPFKYKWNVPVKYITSDDLKNPKLIWLNKDQDSVALECGNTPCWVKLNYHQVGYYRVNYPFDQWDLFSVQLMRNPHVLDVEDRANLISDAFSLATARYFYYNIPLNLIRYLKLGKEKHFYPWFVASVHLKFIKERFSGTDAYLPFLKFVQALIKPNLNERIWDFGPTVPVLQKKLNLQLIEAACWAEDSDTLEKIKDIFNEWLFKKNPPHPELRSLVYCYGLASDVTEEVWTKVLTYLLEEVTEVKEKFDIWCALGKVKNEEYLKKLIELAKDPENLKSQDFFFVLTYIASHPLGLQVAWDFIRNEWEYLVETFTLENVMFCRTLYYICSKFGSEERLKETKDFYAKYPEAGSGKRLRKIGLAKIELNIQWSTENYQQIVDWLKTVDSVDFYDPKLNDLVLV